jgi:hypothetical protein
VSDNTAPALTGAWPADMSGMNLCMSAAPAGPTVAEAGAMFTDNCGNVHVTKSGSVTGTDASWTVTYVYDVVDDCGNHVTPNPSVTYSGGDQSAPVPDLATLPTITGECSAAIPAPPTATDNCAGSITGTTADLTSYTTQGSYTVTWTYADGNGNSVMQTQAVIVHDVTAPVPDLATLPTITGECSAAIPAPPTATDNCTGTITGTTADLTSYTTQGTYTVTWSYADGNGNNVTQTQTVIVHDVTAPTINAKPAITLWPPNHQYVTVSAGDMVSSIIDNCTTLTPANLKITSVWSDEPEDATGNGDGNTLNDIVINPGCNSVQLRSERSGTGNGRVYTVNFGVNDGNGNVSTYAFKVNVPHDQNSTAVDDGPSAGYTVNGTCGAPKQAEFTSSIPAGYALDQNYPNPFNPATTITFAIPAEAQVRLSVYDLSGRTVAMLVDGLQTAGMHSVSFNAAGLTSGIYLYRLESEGVVINKTMDLAK